MTTKGAIKYLESHGFISDDVKDMCIKALEKQIPKKQKGIDDYESHLKLSNTGFLCCSATNKDIRYPAISLEDLDYCPRCGQKLDWSDEE